MTLPQRIYLDWNATTPPHPTVIAAMHEAIDAAWANPASVHHEGQRARGALDGAREAVGALVQFHPQDVTLTSGGTEANNLALWHAFTDAPSEKGLVVSRIEHPSVLRTAERLAQCGVAVQWVEPGPDGRVCPEDMVAAMDGLGDRLSLVALQAVNHETGVIQPVAAVAEEVKRRGALLHVDAVQAIGKLDPELWLGADSISVAAHKIRGPKGIGALATRPGIKLRPLLRGGEQEKGVRPGTQDGLAAAGFAVAAQRALTTVGGYQALAPLRDGFEASLVALGAAHGVLVSRNGKAVRAPHVSNLSWAGWHAPELCAALDLEGVAVSSGAACSAGTASPSPIITAMLGDERAREAVRVSLGETTTESELNDALLIWTRVLERANN